MTDAERGKLIRDRQQSSLLWQWVHRLGSLKQAVVLILVIAVACAIATIYESKFNSAVAQYYIYENPLFILWLVLLCLNLICSAATRWPWQRKHLGFVITHGGIILLLVGAVIGKTIGWEASVTLNKGEEPTGLLLRNETILLFEGVQSGEIYTTPLSVKVRPPSEKKPRIYTVPESKLELVADNYSEGLAIVSRLVEDEQAGTAEGVHLVLHSNMMGQDLNVNLMATPAELATYDMFGLAKIKLLDKLPPLDKTKKVVADTYRETQMILANNPDQPVAHNTSGKLTGYQFLLERNATGTDFTLKALGPSKRERSFPIKEILDKTFPGEEEGTTIQVVRFWNDLKMVNGAPVEASNEPNNPAALITLSGFLEPEKKAPIMLLARKDSETVAFRVLRGETVLKEGVLDKNTAQPLGWADWAAKVEGSYAKAKMVSQTEEAPKLSSPDQQTIPGLRVHLRSDAGEKGPTVWLASGTTRLLQLDQQLVRVGFGLKTQRIPFTVGLENFQVPRDPGTDIPANYISSVRFHDPKTGEKIAGHIEMNHPASYPDDLWRAFTGSTFKFSQAGWDPKNLNQTSLQVLHDPGWLLKWIGSLLISLGIFMSFYWKDPVKKSTEV